MPEDFEDLGGELIPIRRPGKPKRVERLPIASYVTQLEKVLKLTTEGLAQQPPMRHIHLVKVPTGDKISSGARKGRGESELGDISAFKAAAHELEPRQEAQVTRLQDHPDYQKRPDWQETVKAAGDGSTVLCIVLNPYKERSELSKVATAHSGARTQLKNARTRWQANKSDSELRRVVNEKIAIAIISAQDHQKAFAQAGEQISKVQRQTYKDAMAEGEKLVGETRSELKQADDLVRAS